MMPFLGGKNFTFDHQGPNVKPKDTQKDDSINLEFAYVNVNASKLSASLVSKIIHLEASYREGELTLSGLKRKKSRLISEVLQSNTDHLIYHKESEWPPEVKISENINKNISSVIGMNKLGQQENKTKITSKGNYNKPVNATGKLGSRTLLWAQNTQGNYDNTNKGKQIFKVRNPSHKRRSREKKLVDDGTLGTYMGSLPWEKQNLFPKEDLQEEKPTLPIGAKRHLMDMFAESLLHVNRLFNSEYGYQARRVPAHMPHFINKAVMESLQDK